MMKPSPLPEPVSRLIEEFSKLPGIGPKTASRLTYYLLRASDDQSQSLAAALQDFKARTKFCEICFNLTESQPCSICADPNRDHGVICVVENPLDVLAIEKTGIYNGLYHVLHGAISPIEGIGPDQIKLRQLLARLDSDRIRELIIATNPSLEGESTAMYIRKQLEGTDLAVSRLARGLPVGGDLEYADQVTLARALEGRSLME